MSRYIYTTEDLFMKKAKLSDYTKESLLEYTDALGKDDTEIELITPKETPINSRNLPSGLYETLTGTKNEQKGQILIWDEDSRSYKIKEIDIKKYLDDHSFYLNNRHLPKKELDNLSGFYNKKASSVEVSNSLSGCITFKPDLTFYASRSDVDVDNRKDFKPDIRITLQDPQILNTQKTSSIDSPLITDVPETRGGTYFSRYSTDNFVSRDGAASVRKLINDSLDDNRNKIGGYLDTVYDRNTGRFECGTRAIIVRLLKDLPGVTYPELPENIESERYDSFYGVSAQNDQRGDWNFEDYSCSGITLYVHANNKNIFGPMFLRGFESTERENVEFDKKETVLIVNRTPSSFTKGDVVIAFYMDGEWLPVKLPLGDAKPPSVSIEKWSFSKIMCDSANYFRDQRWDDWKLGGEKPPTEILNPDSYLLKIRNKFYYALESIYQTGIGKLNLFPFKESVSGITDTEYQNFIDDKSNWDIIGSNFIQSTVLDQISKGFGGNRNETYITNTNFYRLRGDWENTDYFDMLGFWGPVFKEGFNVSQVQKLQNELKPEGDEPVYPADLFTSDGFFNQYHIPAELGNNAPSGHVGIGSPIDDLSKTLSFSFKADLPGFLSGIKAIQGAKDRFYWIDNKDKKLSISGEPLYALSPNNPNEIDFVPLSVEMVSSSHIETSTESKKLPSFVKFPANLDFDNDSGDDTKRPLGEYPPKILYNFISEGQVKYFKEKIPFWNFIRKDVRSTGAAGFIHTTWGNTSYYGNLVGVISAKCAIRLTGQQHQIKFDLDQIFGMNSKLSTSSGGSSLLSIIGDIIINGIAGNGATSRGDASWGRSSNKISDLNITALHTQIYDAWPESQTILDSRYFSVLHFNPGVLDSTSGSTTVDFLVPTAHNNTLIPVSDTPIPIGQVLDKKDWKYNYIRRGQLLSLDGFRYIEPYLSVKNVDPTPGVQLPKSGEFSSPGLIVKIENNSLVVLDGGKNLLNRGDITLFGANSSISVKIKDYIVKAEYKTDLGPKRRVPVTLLTDVNNEGKPSNGSPPGVVNGLKTHLISIPEKNPSGKYDIFFHFHNDITHTTHSEDGLHNPIQQHVSVKISTE